MSKKHRTVRITKHILIASALWLSLFGADVQNQVSKIFNWGVAAEYAYTGTLDVDKQSAAPVALGGRGDLAGSYQDAGIFFIAVNFNWVF